MTNIRKLIIKLDIEYRQLVSLTFDLWKAQQEHQPRTAIQFKIVQQDARVEEVRKQLDLDCYPDDAFEDNSLGE